MNRILIALILIFVLTYRGFGQGTGNEGSKILFHGMVMDAISESPLPGSQVIINRSFVSVSDGEGKFAFYVNRRDTVVFRRLGYKSAILLISDTLSGREFLAGIYLHTDTLLIGEVIIVPRLTTLKSDLMNPRPDASKETENAKFNMEVSAYQGRLGVNKLGDPALNYESIRQKQRDDAYSKGQIPSDRIAGISPFLLIPAAYLLAKGLPERPAPLQPRLTEQEVSQLHKKYLETLRNK